MKIPLFDIYYSDAEISAAENVIKSGMWSGEGEEVKKLESYFGNYLGTKYTVALNSGTSALHALLLAYGVGPGDEVITTPFTFIATANAALFVGAKPVFVDIETDTHGIDPKKIENAITKKTRAIIPVHYGGTGCRIKEIRKIAKKNNLILIEDAAEALGAKVDGQKVGTFGDSSIFSLCANKNITSGEGGLITTNSKEIYEKAKLIRSHGKSGDDYVTLGYNFRMSSITAAIARIQLKQLEKINERRRKNALRLSNKLSKIKQVETLKELPGHESVFQLFTIKVQDEKTRNDLKRYLEKNGIGTKVYFSSVHLTSFYRKKYGYRGGEFPVAENLSKRVLSLPIFYNLNSEKINYVVEKIKEFFN